MKSSCHVDAKSNIKVLGRLMLLAVSDPRQSIGLGGCEHLLMWKFVVVACHFCCTFKCPLGRQKRRLRQLAKTFLIIKFKSTCYVCAE